MITLTYASHLHVVQIVNVEKLMDKQFVLVCRIS